MATLYVTAIHIGNEEDITLRALKIMKKVDLIVGEEHSFTEKLLKNYSLLPKTIDSLNEHNHKEKSYELLKVLKKGQDIVLITDHGTPVISDPGWFLVKLCYENNIKVEPIPGVSSITTALSIAGLKIDSFIFFSRIPRKKDERKNFFVSLRKNLFIKVFLDAPYRLKKVLEDVYYILSKNSYVVLCYELTSNKQQVLRGNVKTVLDEVKKINLKGEFILIVDNNFNKNVKQLKKK